MPVFAEELEYIFGWCSLSPFCFAVVWGSKLALTQGDRGVQRSVSVLFGPFWQQLRFTLDSGNCYSSWTVLALADDRAGIRQALQADFNLRPDSAQNRASVASVVAAWDTAKHAHEEDIKIRQEAKGLGTVRPLPHTDRSAMLRAVETAKGRKSQKDQPSTDYVAMLLEEIEQDEVTAHPLDEVVSRKDAQSLQLQSSLDQSGRVRITR